MNKSQWPKSYTCRFIEPGLVHYNEFGTVLVSKPVLDNMAQSFVGKPVLDIAHQEVNPEIYADGEADGIVTKVWYNEGDGWYWAEYLVWSPEAKTHCESGQFSVSCAYNADSYSDAGGIHNSLKYDQEILKGTYEHLAIVANPRYEGARIVYNSKGGNAMRLKFWQKDEKVENSTEIDIEKTTLTVDGVEVKMNQIIQNWKESNAPKIDDESTIEVDGKKVAVKDMINSYREKLKNDADDKDKKEKDDMKNDADEKKKKEEEDRKNAEDKEKKEKEDLKNSHEHGDHKEPMASCAMCNSAEGKAHFEKLKNSAGLRGEPQEIKIVDRKDKIKLGSERYGSPKQA